MIRDPAHGMAAFRECNAIGADCADVATNQGRRTDWEAIQAEYRAGLLSLREIATEHHVSHTAIRKRAARDGWRRDLMARIRARADALVSRTEVSSEVSTESRVMEAAIVETNAQAVMHIRLQHRRDIARARSLAISLLDDLETIGANMQRVERLVVAVARNTGPDRKGLEQRAVAVGKAFDLPSRAGMMKILADTMAKLIALERQTYAMDTDSGEKRNPANDQLAELLRRIDGAGTGLPGHSRYLPEIEGRV